MKSFSAIVLIVALVTPFQSAEACKLFRKLFGGNQRHRHCSVRYHYHGNGHHQQFKLEGGKVVESNTKHKKYRTICRNGKCYRIEIKEETKEKDYPKAEKE